MGSILLDGVRIGTGSLVGAGALVTPGTNIPPGSLVIGSPAKVKRASASRFDHGTSAKQANSDELRAAIASSAVGRRIGTHWPRTCAARFAMLAPASGSTSSFS